MHSPHFPYHSVKRYLGCFHHLLEAMSIAVMNIGVQISPWDAALSSFGFIPKGESLDHKVILFSILRNKVFCYSTKHFPFSGAGLDFQVCTTILKSFHFGYSFFWLLFYYFVLYLLVLKETPSFGYNSSMRLPFFFVSTDFWQNTCSLFCNLLLCQLSIFIWLFSS